MTYYIDVKDSRNKFSAAHFLLLEKTHKCSRLHGHNYTVNVSIQGPLDKDYFVVDFVKVKQKLQDIVEVLDHHILIPTKSEVLKYKIKDEEVSIDAAGKKYVIPKGDICFLPIPATTSENLAKYIFDLIKPEFEKYKLKISVGETSMTKAVYQEE